MSKPFVEGGDRSRPALRAVLATLRPRQWFKNSFVLAPLVFAKHLFDASYALRAIAAFAVFCALSGAVYAFNDVRDAAQDSEHPTKRRRPVAAGELSERAALVLAVLLAVSALFAGAALSLAFCTVAAGYLANNVAYTLLIKRIPFVDVLSIAGGFLLRVVAGAFAVGVVVSPWLLVCTGLIACLLGLGKRAHELSQARASDRAAATTRAALSGYRLGPLRAILIVLAVATMTAYALYTRDDRTVAFFVTEQLIWTTPFCVLGIGRFLQLALSGARDDSPTDTILRDPMFLLNLAAWGAAVVAIIYQA